MKNRRDSAPDKVFLDANILFSAAWGSPGALRLWDLSIKGVCTLLASRYVIEEARRNLSEPGHKAALEQYLKQVEIVSETDPEIPCPTELPPKDRPVLMAAIMAQVGFLITGDLKHFGPYYGQIFTGVKICRLRDYLQQQA